MSGEDATGTRPLVDADILIDVARAVPKAMDWLRQAEKESRVAASVVTQMELVVGCRGKAEPRALDRLLGRFRLVPLESIVSPIAVKLLRRYRLSHGLFIPDAVIAGTAKPLGVPLATKNQRLFRFIAGLQLLPYPGSPVSSP